MSAQRGPEAKNSAATEPIDTLLQRWLGTHGFTSAQLERTSGIGRQAMMKIRQGADLRRKTMIRICRGASTLVGYTVRMDELFDLDPYSEENVRLVPLNPTA